MSLTLCVLASGSSGNCAYVASEQTAILVDAGLSWKEIGRRLELIGTAASEVKGICLTHEHDDHMSALAVISRKTGMALYANSGTIQGVEGKDGYSGLAWNVFRTGEAFSIADIRVEPFSVPHDTFDPVGFVLSSGASRIGIVTDMGMVTELIRQRLKGCGAVVIESNHDPKLLKKSKRAWSVKQRIAGWQGHLSNEQAGELLTEIAGPALRYVFLAHLSSECNTPEAAARSAQAALAGKGWAQAEVKLTYPDRPSEKVCV